MLGVMQSYGRWLECSALIFSFGLHDLMISDIFELRRKLILFSCSWRKYVLRLEHPGAPVDLSFVSVYWA
jgi:hypothetical protein